MFKDPVCNMMVDEKKAKHISVIDGKKATYALLHARLSLIKALASMDTSNNNNNNNNNNNDPNSRHDSTLLSLVIPFDFMERYYFYYPYIF